MPFQERMNRVHQLEAELLGSDPGMSGMYQRQNLENWLNDPLIPAEKAYLDLYREDVPELTESEARSRVWEMLDENDLNLFLQENLPYESPYV